MLTIEEAVSATPDLAEAFAELIPQLSASSPPPSAAELAEIIAAPGATVFVARLDGQVVGTLNLVTLRVPTGGRAWIEDVVVDDDARGHGAGEALTRAALEKAA